MTTETEVIDANCTLIESKPVALYDVTDAAIEELKQELTGLAEYSAVSKGITKVRTLRTRIEATRKQLKADSLAWGRKVDAEAKRITEALEAIEEPLKRLKQQIDEAKEREKAAIEAARRVEIENRIRLFADLEYPINPLVVAEFTKEELNEELAKASEAFKAVLADRKLKAEQAEAERLRVIAEEKSKAEALRLERIALAKERAELEAEKAKRDEADRLRREAVEEQERIARIEQARIKAEQEEAHRKANEALEAERAKLQAERDKLEAKQREDQAKIDAERSAKQEAERLEMLKPDAEKIMQYGRSIYELALTPPEASTVPGRIFIAKITQSLIELMNECKEFGK